MLGFKRGKSRFFLITICFLLGFVFFTNSVYGGLQDDYIFLGADGNEGYYNVKTNQILTEDQVATEMQKIIETNRLKKEAQKEVFYKWASNAFYTVTNKVLNRLAFDAATWVGSAGMGQSAMWEKRSWGEYLKDIGDNSFGDAIEELGKMDGVRNLGLNICEPDFSVKMRIGLGLVAERVGDSDCTYTKFVDNWDKAITELSSTDFLKQAQQVFGPQNDLNVAMSLHVGILENEENLKYESKLKREETKGWLNVTDLSDNLISPPGHAERILDESYKASWDNVSKDFGDALTNAANTFLNQLAITAMNTLMATLGKNGDVDLNYLEDKLSNSPFRDPDTYSTGKSAKSVASKARKIENIYKQEVDIDFNLLTTLVSCPDPNNAGPDNCVIDEGFMTAVLGGKTVAEAIADGDLRADNIFGFLSDGSEPTNVSTGDSYPYRSMPILRKYRILPVGWEVAAEAAKTAGAQVTLGDMMTCFDSGDKYPGFYQAWCHGMVDPNWVLKIPENFCKRQGYGEQYVATIQDSGEWMVNRSDDYCADNQSCISKDKNGKCIYYGYCTNERRTWDFSSEACEPRSNTCQSFSDSEGRVVSYLKNTLDFGACNTENSGCAAYCLDYDYATSEFCSAPGDDIIYLNDKSKTCEADSDGCRELIRTKPGLGANLVFNSSFEDVDAAIDADPNVERFCGTEFFLGDCSMMFTTGGSGDYSVHAALFDPSSYPLAQQKFTLSLYAKNCGANAELVIRSNNPITDLATTSILDGSSWQRYSVSRIFTGGDDIAWEVNDAADGCLIDAVKIERGDMQNYSEYAAAGAVYEKILPNYLESACYVTPGVDYRYKDNHPVECDNYARKCSASEIGCEMYTSAEDGMATPARVVDADYCAAECAGYDDYLQAESMFDSSRPAQFIPATAKQCSAAAAGCDEFTNLDAVKNGGETVEYYSYLRQCELSTSASPSADCAEFYAWTGDESTAMGIMKFSLKRDVDDVDSDGNTLEPTVTADDSAECNEAIYNLPATDPGYNSDCRAFYDTTGQISYHLYERTVTCSENCYQYRKAENNVVKDSFGENITSAECNVLLAAHPGQVNYNAASSECVFCKNGGSWDAGHGACVYQAIPNEGSKCSAAENKCREYSGSTGNNTQIVSNSDFEGDTQGWTGVGGAVLTLSADSLRSGENALAISGGAHAATTSIFGVSEGKSYVVRLLVKSNGLANAITKISITNGTDESIFSIPGSSGLLSGNWRIYEFDLAGVTYQAGDNDALRIEVNGDFSIDDVRLTEIVDRHFLVKDSWNTPEACVHDIFGNPAGQFYNVGCSAYKDRDNMTHYLKSFSYLCQDSAVGCELLVDTQNSDTYAAKAWNDDNSNNICDAGEADCRYVAADRLLYAVYDKEKQCESENKGCELMGRQYEYDGDLAYKKEYRTNDPDMYDDSGSPTLCRDFEDGCSSWAVSDGSMFFKDPGLYTCEWRQGDQGGQFIWDWYRTRIDRCDSDKNGAVSVSDLICFTDTDCGAGISCVTETSDVPCPTRTKTIGYGEGSPPIDQPAQDASGIWAGLCAAEASGCTEYVDPVSQGNLSLISNGDFTRDSDSDGNPDYWVANVFEKTIGILPNTLYVLSAQGAVNVTIESISGNNYFSILNTTFGSPDQNNFAPAYVNSITAPISAGVSSVIFYTSGAISAADLRVRVSDATPATNREVALRAATVDYQLTENIDKKSCGGYANFDEGCILFNERTYNGGYSNFLHDAQNSYGSMTVAPCGPSGCDSNVVIKVKPDRECNRWLSCGKKVPDAEDNMLCAEVIDCTDMDKNGNCIYSFKSNSDRNWNFSADQNATGYVLMGKKNLGSMDELGTAATVSNGDFDYFTDEGEPLNWSLVGDGTWDYNYSYVVNRVPMSGDYPGFGIEYPAHGPYYLRLGSAKTVKSSTISVSSGDTYYLSYMVNTSHLASEDNSDASSTITIKGVTNRTFEDRAGVKGWRTVVQEFIAPGSSITIELSSSGLTSSTTGWVYFDDIKIEPILDIGDGEKSSKKCRLYPEADSVRCESVSMVSGIKPGIEGYCLQYDKYPGNPNACIMWYPVDKIKSTNLMESGAGYSGKFPLYYCAEMDANFAFVEYRNAFYKGSNCHGGNCAGGDVCPEGYDLRKDGDCGDCGHHLHDVEKCHCVPSSNPIYANDLILADNTTVPENFDECNRDQNTVEGVRDGWYVMDNYNDYHVSVAVGFSSSESRLIKCDPSSYDASFGYYVNEIDDTENLPTALDGVFHPCSVRVISTDFSISFDPDSPIPSVYSYYSVFGLCDCNDYLASDPSCNTCVGDCDNVAPVGDRECWYRDPSVSEYSSGTNYWKYIDQHGNSYYDRISSHPMAHQGMYIYDFTTNQIMPANDYLARCNTFYQVVSEVGDDKAWADRVNTGSDYVTSLGYDYDSMDSPYGSAIPPAGLENKPGKWDAADGNVGKYPNSRIPFYNYAGKTDGQAKSTIAGLPYGCYGPDDAACSNGSAYSFGHCSGVANGVGSGTTTVESNGSDKGLVCMKSNFTCDLYCVAGMCDASGDCIDCTGAPTSPGIGRCLGCSSLMMDASGEFITGPAGGGSLPIVGDTTRYVRCAEPDVYCGSYDSNNPTCIDPGSNKYFDYEGAAGVSAFYNNLQCPPGQACVTRDRLPSTVDGAKDRIKDLFTQSYRAVRWNGSADSGYYAPFKNGGPVEDSIQPPTALCDPQTAARDTLANPYCIYRPKITGVTLSCVDEPNVPITATTYPDGVFGSFNVPKTGDCVLKFYTDIDNSQAPIRRIDVRWSNTDSDEPLVTGRLSERSEAVGKPHIFTKHYPAGPVDHFQISITDNWGATATSSGS